MRVTFFQNTGNLMYILKMENKSSKNFYRFSDTLIWIGNGKFSLLLREYSQLAVNVLTSSPKKSDLNKNNFS